MPLIHRTLSTKIQDGGLRSVYATLLIFGRMRISPRTLGRHSVFRRDLLPTDDHAPRIQATTRNEISRLHFERRGVSPTCPPFHAGLTPGRSPNSIFISVRPPVG